MIDFSNDPKMALQTIKYRDYDNNIKEIDPNVDLSFSKDNIPYETQAVTYFQVSQLAEIANRNYEDKKLSVDSVYSMLYAQYSVSLTKELKKKPTENALSAAIKSDQTYIQTSQELNEAEYKYRVLLRLTKAFEQRKDLMQTLSASKRAEMQQPANTAFKDGVEDQINAKTQQMLKN